MNFLRHGKAVDFTHTEDIVKGNISKAVACPGGMIRSGGKGRGKGYGKGKGPIGKPKKEKEETRE